jgi:putative transposase
LSGRPFETRPDQESDLSRCAETRAEACQAQPGTTVADVLAVYEQLLPVGFLDALCRQQGRRQNSRVYTDRVVMWLMVTQRLQGAGTLEGGVLELIRGLPASFWPRPCKRIRLAQEGKAVLSDNTGSYNEARQDLPPRIVAQGYDHMFQGWIEKAQVTVPSAGRQAFFFDGTDLRAPHTPELCQAFPPASNQHGSSHWPVLRMLVAHDLDTGLALRPEWDSQAVSEQQLLERLLDRLPRQAILVGDTNFGVFSVAYRATQHQHPALLRLQLCRARRICPEPLQDGIDRQVCWRPSREERKKHHLPADACVRGRILVRQVQPSNGSPPFLLALFTTLDWPAEEIFPLYGKRWFIETDLRSLKSTLELEQLTCTSKEMVAKEIIMAMLTYNLVRATAWLAAQAAGVAPRTLSFTRVRNLVQAFAPLLAQAQNEQEAQQIHAKMMHYAKRAKIRNHNRKQKSFPRAVWGRPQVHPKRKS